MAICFLFFLESHSVIGVRWAQWHLMAVWLETTPTMRIHTNIHTEAPPLLTPCEGLRRGGVDPSWGGGSNSILVPQSQRDLSFGAFQHLLRHQNFVGFSGVLSYPLNLRSGLRADEEDTEGKGVPPPLVRGRSSGPCASLAHGRSGGEALRPCLCRGWCFGVFDHLYLDPSPHL